MKFLYSFILLIVLNTGCKPKALSGKELENRLEKAMTDHLNETFKSGTTFTIKDFNYYPDKLKDLYICIFTVEVRTATSDTTGAMRVLISKDFKTVTRTQ